MHMEVPICPTCGGVLVYSNDANRIKCRFCRNTVVVKEAVKQGKLSVDGIPTLADYINSGYLSLELGNFSKALSLFENALTLAPNNYRIWWGIVLSGTKNLTYYGDGVYKTEAQKALEYSDCECTSNDIRSIYNDFIERINNYLDSMYSDDSWKYKNRQN